MSDHTITIRPAVTLADANAVLVLIDQLAKFENLDGPDEAAKERFYADGFERTPPRFSALLTFVDSSDEPCGYAIYFDIYSTFLCKPSLYLEDLFVLPESRGKGVGKALFAYLVETAKKSGYGRIDWECLDWNVKAQEFYSKIGATHVNQWMHYRMDEAAIDRFAAEL